MAKKSKADKAADRRVELAYYASCSGIEIMMMDIPKVFAFGRGEIDRGASDDDLQLAIRAFVETIRHN
jgi:hypothetical protein